MMKNKKKLTEFGAPMKRGFQIRGLKKKVKGRKRKKVRKNELFHRFPDNCWTMVCEFIDSPRTIMNLTRTCKHIRRSFQFSGDVVLNDHLTFSIQCRSGNVISLLNRFKTNRYVRRLRIDGSSFSGKLKSDKELTDAIFRKFPFLKSLSIQKVDKLSILESFYSVAPMDLDRFKPLEEISISGSGQRGKKTFRIFGKTNLQKLLDITKHPRILCFENIHLLSISPYSTLLSLRLKNIDNLDVKMEIPSLRELEMTNVGFTTTKKLKLRFPKLEKLRIIFNKNERLKKTSIFSLLNMFGGLDKNEYEEGKKYRDSTFCDLPESLKELSLEGFKKGLTGSFFRKSKCSRNIQKLSIARSSYLSPTHIAGNLNPKSLRELNISGCSGECWNDTFLLSQALESLQVLNLSNCNQPQVSSFGFTRYQKLRKLDISKCYQESLNEEFIRTMFQQNPDLKRIKFGTGYFTKLNTFFRRKWEKQLERFKKVKVYATGNTFRWKWVDTTGSLLELNMIKRCKKCENFLECNCMFDCEVCEEKDLCVVCGTGDLENNRCEICECILCPSCMEKRTECKVCSKKVCAVCWRQITTEGKNRCTNCESLICCRRVIVLEDDCCRSCRRKETEVDSDSDDTEEHGFTPDPDCNLM